MQSKLEESGYDYAAYGTYYGGQDIADGGCGNSPQLNDFSSKEGMEHAGWWFNWTDDFTFKPLMYKDFVPPYSYWGFQMHGSGAISLRVKGEGVLSLDFGNLLGTPGSQVSAYLNLDKKASAGPSVLSKTVDMPFHNADALTIVQDTAGIMVINRISFRCTPTTTIARIMTSSSPEDPIKRAEEIWKQEHAKLEKAASLAEKKQQEHYAAVKLAQAQKLIMERNKAEEAELKSKEEERSHEAAKEKEAQDKENDRLVKALMDVLDKEGGEAKLGEIVNDAGGDYSPGDALDNSSGRGSEEAFLKQAKAQEELAKNLELAARNGGQAKDLAEAQRLTREAQAEEERARAAIAKAKKLREQEQRVMMNESWAEELLANANAQAERTQKELEEAERAEDEQAKKSDEAAKVMKAVLKQKEDEDQERQERQHKEQERQRREKERERKRLKRQEAEAAAALAKSMVALTQQTTTITVTTTTTTTSTARGLGTSLYCYCLMLPFGYEPKLLAAQKQKKVGVFECDEFTVFSNSTMLLDTGHRVPLHVELLSFTLAVPYGGKWHTALNTPVFNKIWTKVKDMGIYLKHDWVVKADPDTVWFPKRLVQVLRKRMPKAVVKPWQRRLQDTPVSDGCKHCRLQGLEFDTCDLHVQWLQKNKNYSCEEALKTTARPPPADCGCKCTRLEACDLSQDVDWAQDGRFIRGDLAGVKDPRLATSPRTQAMIYVNNCRFGLHGPIEVLSSAAVSAFADGLHRCDFLLAQPWGEDKFLDRCMLALGVTRVNIFGMLSETACGEEPAPCGGADVAFHPFKKFDEYFACWAFAHSFGHGPASTRKGLQVAQDGSGFL